MFSLSSSADHLSNMTLALGLTALATAASLELRAPGEVARLVRSASEVLSLPRAGSSEYRDTDSTLSGAEKRPMSVAKTEDRVAPDPDPEIQVPALALAPYAPAKPDASSDAINVVVADDRQSETRQMAGVETANVLSGVDRAPAVPTQVQPAALPAKPGIIFEDTGNKACIGGTLCEEHCKSESNGCEAKPAYVIKLGEPAYISTVQLYAHDGVGPSRRSQLLVKVNGEPVGKTDVYRNGSTLSVKVGRTGQLVTIESMHQHNGFLRGGEEAVIWDVFLLGRAPR
jgi:hypothetical protein